MEYVSIDKVAEFINGYGFKPEDWHNEGKKIIRIQNLTDKSKPYNLTNTVVPDKFIVRKGDLLVSWSATLDVFEWDDTEDAYLNQHIFKVNIDADKVNKDYLKWSLMQMIESMKKYTHGSTMKHIVKDDFHSTMIPLPAIKKQEYYVDLINKADSIRKKRRQQIQLADDFLRATFLDMFGDPVSNKKNYPIKTLSEICTKITDGTHDTPERLKEGIKFITGKHIRPFCIDFENSDYVTSDVHNEIYRRCNPEHGDILYTNIGVNLGTAAMNTVRYEFSMKNVALLKPDPQILSSRFLEHVLNFSAMKDAILRKASLGGAQQFMSLAIINNIELPIPPIELQIKFSSIAEQIEKNKAKQYLTMTEYENLFNSLMQRAFRGEL